MIRFACTGCDARFTVEDSQAGQVGECPACRARFVIPGADPKPLDAPSLPASDEAAPDTRPVAPRNVDPDAPVAVKPCPACGASAAVRPRDVGHRVNCPTCTHEYRADALSPDSTAPVSPRTRRRRRDWGDEDRYPDRRRRSRRRDEKPGNVTAVGAMLLAGGIYGLVFCGTTLLASGAVCFACLVWPPWWAQLVWSIFAIVRGQGVLGVAGGTLGRPRTLHVLQILCILNLDVVNCILGVVGLCLANAPEAQEYFDRESGYARTDDE